LAEYTTIPTKGFNKEIDKLSDTDKALVFNKVAMMEDDPFYPSLRTKKLRGTSYYESSVNMSIRIIWRFDGNKIILLIDVGHHDILKKY
jgi:mRNA-degrading endonuclease RelE of RelBE toxin-antitoxin system